MYFVRSFTCALMFAGQQLVFTKQRCMVRSSQCGLERAKKIITGLEYVLSDKWHFFFFFISWNKTLVCQYYFRLFVKGAPSMPRVHRFDNMWTYMCSFASLQKKRITKSRMEHSQNHCFEICWICVPRILYLSLSERLCEVNEIMFRRQQTDLRISV